MIQTDEIYDLIIIGGGPAGAVAAIWAKRLGLKTLLLEQSKFPREKTCGGAISPHSLEVLRELDLNTELEDLPGAKFHKVVLVNTHHIEAEIDLRRAKTPERRQGYVFRREVFDHFLFRHAKLATTACHENFHVDDLVIENSAVAGVSGHHTATGARSTFRGKIVLSADGYRSIVAQKLGFYEMDLSNSIFAIRQYYRNVTGTGDRVELHFLPEVAPCYFWIFPLEEGLANIGIGMGESDMKSKGVNLVEVFEAAKRSPRFASRFVRAEPMEKTAGWHLPVGGKHRKCHGQGYMLAGDAAGIIDPFTGEGIANAMLSGRLAAETAALACNESDFGELSLSRYDKKLWSTLGGELTNGAKLQKIIKYKPLLDFVIRKAANNTALRDDLCAMGVGDNSREALTSPIFYLRLLFS